jgi:hypothetical protein
VSTYREIIGKKIKKVSSDPSSGLDGEMWYNSTTGQIRGLAISQAWASASPMITARSKAGGTTSSNSTQSAGLAFGGQAGTAVQSLNEEYNGSGWSTGGALGTARRWHYGAGSQTAALCAGGVAAAGATPVTANSEEYNGSSWTEGENMGTGRYNGGSGGTQTAAFATGGSPAPSYTNATEEYDGTDWTAGGVLPVSKGYFGGGGTLTAGIVMGIGASSTDSYEYDGSSWTAGGTMNRGCSQGSYAGLQTDGISFGGTPPTTATEHYNGTAWTNYPAMATARYALAGASGTASAAMGSGGYAPPDKNTTEEFTSSTNVITAGAWAAGGALNTGRINVSMGGTQTAGIVLGGHISPGGEPKGVETYDGSSFTAATAIGPYPGDYAAYAGPSTSGIIFGGAPYSTNTAEYDGEWSAGGALSTGRSQLMGAGSGETSAVAIGGFTDSTTSTTATEEYGGTSWTGGGAMSTQRGRGAGFGIETAALVVGGNTSPDTAVTANSEEYGGTSWTSGGSIFTATGTYIGGWGTQTDGAIVGGANPSYVATTLGYDGTSWSTLPSAAYAAGRTQTAGANGSAGLRAGGGPNTSQRDGSEEFTGETETVNIKTFTTS